MKFPQVTRVELPPNELAEKVKSFGCHRLTVTFDKENYLMFDYPYDGDMSNTMVIENDDGDLLFATTYNCGYGGHGPGKTEKLLKAIGIEANEAEELKWLDGFQLIFNPDGTHRLLHQFESFPFRSQGSKIDLSTVETVCNFKKRQLYFINPQKKGFTTLLRTLDLINIDDIKVYVGKDNKPYYDFSMPYIPMGGRNLEATLQGSFIIFEGRPFDVVCFVGTTAPASIINTLTMYVLGYPLLHESEFGEHILLESRARYGESKIRKLVKSLKEHKEIYLSAKAKA